jgi:F-type H+-transporting ATPase subunit b
MSAAAHIPVASSSGSFLITPNVGLMVWVFVVVVIVYLLLRRSVFPVIGAALDARANAIASEIDSAENLRKEADQVLAEYRQRLAEARTQADEIVTRARQAGEATQKEAVETARAERERLLEQTRRDVEAETRRAIDEIRREVADLTVLATEKVTRKTLTEADQRRLVEEALSDLDFSVLGGGEG